MILGFAVVSILLENDSNLTTSLYIYIYMYDILQLYTQLKPLSICIFPFFKMLFGSIEVKNLDRSSPWTVVLSVELNK